MVTNQAFLFLIFVINGLLIGLIFDIFRIFRISFKTKDIITYLQDILFWLISGGIVLYSIFVFNNGEIRFFMFLGISIGVILYISLFSQYIIKTNVFIIKFLKNILSKIFSFIKIPFSFLWAIIKKPLIKPITFITINTKKLIFLMRQKSTKIMK